MFNLKKCQNKTDNNTATHSQAFRDDVDADVVLKIKSILKTSPSKAQKTEVYVPEQLNDIIDELQVYVINAGVIMKEIINISYGKKIKATIGLKEAEVNLFYGKRGFSVVQSPRTGTSKEMNELLSELINAFLRTYI